jgi:transposase InsO family protein
MPTPPLTSAQEQHIYKIYYDEGHFFGRDKLFKLIQHRGLPISRRQLWQWLKKQQINQVFQPVVHKRKLQPTLLTQPRSQIAIDLSDMQLLEKRNYKYIFVAIDLFTKFVWVEALKNKENKQVVAATSRILRRMKPKPASFRSDNGSEFKSKEFQELMNKQKIKQVFSLPFTPQSNGGVERVNRTLKSMIKKNMFANPSFDWSKELQSIVSSYNNSYQSTIKMTPEEAEKGDASEIHANIKHNIDLRNKPAEQIIEVGDTVRILQEDGMKNWSNDIFRVYKVSKPKTNVGILTYYIKDSDDAKLSSKFYANDLLKIDAVYNEVKQPEKHQVQKLIRPAVQNGVAGYVVKWRGYPTSENTFEPREQLLEDVPKIVRTFDRKQSVKWNNANNAFNWNESKMKY